MIDVPDQMRDALASIADLGVNAQLDDFGTGYSSLTFLHHFSGDAIKIDRSFVMSMHTDSANEEIIRAIIELAHNLGLKVIAEGVEEEEQLELLLSVGCECAQGYLFAKPLKPEATGASWKSGTSRRWFVLADQRSYLKLMRLWVDAVHPPP